MKNSEQLEKHKNLLWPALLFLVVVIGLVFLKPKITDIFQLRQQIVKDKNSLAQLTQKIDALEGLDEKELETKTEKVLKALPPEKNVAGLLATLRILGQETGVELKSIQVSPGELSTRSAQISASTKVPLLSFKLTASGNQKNIRDFFDRVETNLPLMKISTINLTQSKEELVEAKLELDSLYLLLPLELGPIETPLAAITQQEEKAYQELIRFKIVEKMEYLPLIPSGKENPFIF